MVVEVDLVVMVVVEVEPVVIDHLVLGLVLYELRR